MLRAQNAWICHKNSFSFTPHISRFTMEIISMGTQKRRAGLRHVIGVRPHVQGRKFQGCQILEKYFAAVAFGKCFRTDKELSRIWRTRSLPFLLDSLKASYSLGFQKLKLHLYNLQAQFTYHCQLLTYLNC
jgi:hypothetical protein